MERRSASSSPWWCLFFLLCLLRASPAAALDSIRLGILSIAPPERTHANWKPFADYLADTSGKPVERVIPHGFAKLKTLVGQGDVDMFYVNAYVFYRLKQAGYARAVAQMENIDGKTLTTSEIFVRKDSGISRVSELQGRRFACLSPVGAGGYSVPRTTLTAAMDGVNYRLLQDKFYNGELQAISVSAEYPENMPGRQRAIPEAGVGALQQIIIGGCLPGWLI